MQGALHKLKLCQYVDSWETLGSGSVLNGKEAVGNGKYWIGDVKDRRRRLTLYICILNLFTTCIFIYKPLLR